MSRDIKVLHLEPTDVCQAACPMCARETDADFRKDRQHHLDMNKITKVFDVDSIAALDKMFMCGNYGDPAAGKHTLTIYKEFRNINPDITLGMNTNGGIQSTIWWYDLGRVFNQQRDYVVFSIDGLKDTNSTYRVNVKWDKIMYNAEAFINAGGSAHWDMLVYRHNEHQVDACEQLAKDMGFKWFRAKVSKRGFSEKLKAPSNWANPRVQSTQIQCHALQEKSAYIDAQGNLSPCCWLGSRLTDFVINFAEIQQSWSSSKPNSICSSVCGTVGNGTSFSNQWQREVQL